MLCRQVHHSRAGALETCANRARGRDGVPGPASTCSVAARDCWSIAGARSPLSTRLPQIRGVRLVYGMGVRALY